MQTRKKIFETNSSSTHSIVVLGDLDFVKVDSEDEKSVIYVDPDRGGYMEEESHDWQEVAGLAYKCAMIKGNDEWVEMLKKVIVDYTKKPVEFNLDHYDCEDGCKGECLRKCEADLDDLEQIFDSEEKLKDVLFRARKVLFMDTTY